MKTVIYYKEQTSEPDLEFMASMQRLALAYKRWDIADSAVQKRIDNLGWDVVFDSDGFDRVDLMADRLTRRYNATFGTQFNTFSLFCSIHLQKAYFCAQNHGLI